MAFNKSKLFLIALFSRFIWVYSVPTSLDINQFRALDTNLQGRAHKHFNFKPKKSQKISEVIYGPIKIWSDPSGKFYIESVLIDTVKLEPQLVSVNITDGAVKTCLYYKWDDGKFISIPEDDFLSFQTLLKYSHTRLSDTLMLDFRRRRNPHSYTIIKQTMHCLEHIRFVPKPKLKLVHVANAKLSIFSTDKRILETSAFMHEDYAMVCHVTVKGDPEIKWFMYDDSWEPCTEEEARAYLISLIDDKDVSLPPLTTFLAPVSDEPIMTVITSTLEPPSKERRIDHSDRFPPSTPPKKESEFKEKPGLPTLPALPPGPIFTDLEVGIPPADLFTDEQKVPITPIPPKPATPTFVVYRTEIFPTYIVLDLNKIGPKFIQESSNYGILSVNTLTPAPDFNVYEITETGYSVFINSRNALVRKIVIYSFNDLILLVSVEFERNGYHRRRYRRNYGKLVICSEVEFNQYLETWKEGNDIDFSVSVSTEWSNNLNLFHSSTRIVDGVQVTSFSAREPHALRRIITGVNEIVCPYNDFWTEAIFHVFNSSSKLLALHLILNGVSLVKYFLCNSSFIELDAQNFFNYMSLLKSQIHIQSHFFFEVNGPPLLGYFDSANEHKEMIPLSGNRLKMLNFNGKTFWTSSNQRCSSVRLYLEGASPKVKLVDCTVQDDHTTTNRYYSFTEDKCFNIEGHNQFQFYLTKFLENTQFQAQRNYVTTPRNFSPNIQYQGVVFELTQPHPNVFSFTDFNSILLSTTFTTEEGFEFMQLLHSGRTLWFKDSEFVCLTITIYYYGTEPKLGEFHLSDGINLLSQYYEFWDASSILIEVDQFNDNLNILRAEKTANECKFSNFSVLNLENQQKLTLKPCRKYGLITIGYEDKENKPFNVLAYGPEILWVGNEGEFAKEVEVTYYDKRPLLLSLSMSEPQQATKLLSSFNQLWTEVEPDVYSRTMAKLKNYEPSRQPFTIPELNETTSYDVECRNLDNLTLRRFSSIPTTVSSLLDGRLRIYAASLYNFLHSINVYYHGYYPKLLSFREKGINGYTFDHFLVFENGWRPTNQSLFSQFFNHFKSIPPQGIILPNQFAYDITTEDMRVSITHVADPINTYRYDVIDPNFSICSVLNNGQMVWQVPLGWQIRTFFIHMRDFVPMLGRFEEVDPQNQPGVSFAKLFDNVWNEIDQEGYNNSYNELALPVGFIPQPLSPEDIHDPFPMDIQPFDPSQEPQQPIQPQQPLQPQQPTQPQPPQPQPQEPPLYGEVLDLSAPVDLEKYRHGRGNYRLVIPFENYQPKPDVVVGRIIVEGKIAFNLRAPDMAVTNVRSFLRDGKPVILQVMVRYPDGKQKYSYAALNDREEWETSDEEMFEAMTFSLMLYYQSEAQP